MGKLGMVYICLYCGMVKNHMNRIGMHWFFPILSQFWIFLEPTRHQYEAFEVNVDSLPSLGVSDNIIPAN